MKKAIIDIGSNSVRLMFIGESESVSRNNIVTKSDLPISETILRKNCEVNPVFADNYAVSCTRKREDAAHSVYNNKKIINSSMLASGMMDGFLSDDSIDRTLAAVADFLAMAKDVGAEKIMIFATEAVRNAKNKQIFLDKMASFTNIRPDILSGEDEATIGFVGAASGITGSVGVIDIGGASVEFIYGNNGHIEYKKSIAVGTITLKNIFGDDVNGIKTHLHSQWLSFPKNLQPNTLLGIGGTLTNLAAMDLALDYYDPARTHNHKLTMQNLEKLEKIVFSDEDLSKSFKTLSTQRKTIIKQGILIIKTLLNYLDITDIIISEKDNLEGYAAYKNI